MVITKGVLDKHIKHIDEKIKAAKAEIPNLPPESIFDRLTVALSRGKTQQSVQDYVDSLEKYKEELADFHNRNKNVIGVYIELGSDKYDEKISVEFVLKSGKILRPLDLDCPWQPSPPDKNHFAFINPIDHRERDIYRTNLEYSTDSISCDLRDLKKGKPVLFVNEGIYIASVSPKISFEIRISSRNSDGLQVFPFDQEKDHITELKDISEIDEFDREI